MGRIREWVSRRCRRVSVRTLAQIIKWESFVKRELLFKKERRKISGEIRSKFKATDTWSNTENQLRTLINTCILL